ncbi:MAG TPA: PP2C family protein-serine/threonine phosphatase [Acidobacteriaceae bacterium]|jgi:serine phosphatase RsbU (regulator of sigma subunit)
MMPSASATNFPPNSPANPPQNSPGQVDIVDLQQQVARLQALLETSRQVHSTVRLEDLLNTVLRIVVRELELPGALITKPRMMYGGVPPEPWEGCPRFPLQTKDGHLLAELVVAPAVGRTLSIYEEDFLEGLSLQAGVALENARYHERNLEWTRVQRDLEAARLIQRSLLPQQMPRIPGYSIAVRSSTCYEVGGDYVDIVELPGGRQIMAVADVAGKGLASCIVGTAFRSAFRAIATADVPLAELAARLNEQHYAEGEEARLHYVTAIFLRLEPVAHMLEVVNAGHNPGFLLREGTAHRITSSGTPIGLVPGMQYHAEQFRFPEGSKLLFYTDGLTEVFKGDDEFGTDRLLSSFSGCNLNESAAILDSLWLELHDFSGGAHQEDDMTALALLREGT